MNIAITTHQANRLRLVLAELLASSERMANHPDASEKLVTESRITADVCLAVINKIVHEQSRGNIARAVLNERITQTFYGDAIGNQRAGLDR
jgi:histidinol dehydrogenase